MSGALNDCDADPLTRTSSLGLYAKLNMLDFLAPTFDDASSYLSYLVAAFNSSLSVRGIDNSRPTDLLSLLPPPLIADP